MRVMAALATAVLAITLTSCSGSSGSSSLIPSVDTSIHVRGALILDDQDSARAAALNGANRTTAGCAGLGGYDDIAVGGEVVISNDAGKTLAITQLKGGYVVDANATECKFSFSAKIPGTGKFYGIAIGHRNTVKFSRAEMKSGPTLTLGDD